MLSYYFFSFGCCSDGETPAGPTDESCEENKDCKNGPFGCCPDGRTWSQGPNKQGCFECPEEVCIFGTCCRKNVFNISVCNS